ncbi:MAG: hypothetical protein KatS3mg032_1381 [Cyclobacteriaceae bacterium]|nr:MAG: hypothetical protein KatS3mg032_1381 [Cyclobacteriaceae bacterium]
MKKTLFNRLNRALAAGLALGAVVWISSCGSDDPEPAAPSLTLSATSFSGLVGADASVDVTISAPGGLASLTVLKNGAAFDNKTYAGETTATYSLDYTIESATAGTVFNFTFQAVDRNGKSSAIANYAVTVSSKEIVVVSGVINSSVTWTSDKIYQLSGYVRVGDDSKRSGGTDITGVVLTIQPGTIIQGLPKSGTTPPGTLIVQRGNQIIANGTADNPIVFTSSKAPGLRNPGDWGGLVIVGRATNNQSANAELEGNYGAFHGVGDTPIADPDNDNSGSLRYVRIEFAGTPINPNQEVNALTLGSVGRATTVEYVQCSFGLDDAFEFFGGTVNAKYLMAYRGLDDDFDVDNGWSGNVQWAIGIRDNTLADQSGSNGFEVDNDSGGSGATPFTSGVFANVTIIGPKKTNDLNIQDNFQNAAHLRRNNKLKIYNAVFTGYPNGVFIDGSTTLTNAQNNELQLRNVILAGVENWGGNGYGSVATTEEQTVTGLPFGSNANHPQTPRGFIFATTGSIGGNSAQTWFLTTAFGNALEDKWTDLGLSPTLFDTGTPSFLPQSGSTLLNRANLWDNCPAAGTFFDKTVNYIGAFGTTDWTTGWTNFNPRTTNYN